MHEGWRQLWMGLFASLVQRIGSLGWGVFCDECGHVLRMKSWQLYPCGLIAPTWGWYLSKKETDCQSVYDWDKRPPLAVSQRIFKKISAKCAWKALYFIYVMCLFRLLFRHYFCVCFIQHGLNAFVVVIIKLKKMDILDN